MDADDIGSASQFFAQPLVGVADQIDFRCSFGNAMEAASTLAGREREPVRELFDGTRVLG